MTDTNKATEELHYALGFLDGLIMDRNLKSKNLKTIKSMLETNAYFNEGLTKKACNVWEIKLN